MAGQNPFSDLPFGTLSYIYFSIIIKSKIGGKSSKESKKGEKEIRRVITIKENTDGKTGSKERRKSKTLGKIVFLNIALRSLSDWLARLSPPWRAIYGVLEPQFGTEKTENTHLR